MGPDAARSPLCRTDPRDFVKSGVAASRAGSLFPRLGKVGVGLFDRHPGRSVAKSRDPAVPATGTGPRIGASLVRGDEEGVGKAINSDSSPCFLAARWCGSYYVPSLFFVMVHLFRAGARQPSPLAKRRINISGGRLQTACIRRP